MRKRSETLIAACICLAVAIAAAAVSAQEEEPTGVHRFGVESIDGEEVSLATYQGKVLLIVNLASG